MTAPKSPKPPIPRWAWIFAAACFVIPVFTVGGAIPTAIGAFSGLGVLGIARQTGKPTRRKVIYCGVVTGSAWTVFLVFLFALTALQTKHPQLQQAGTKALTSRLASRQKSKTEPASAVNTAPPTKPEPQEEGFTLEDRQDIYQQAIRMRYHIDVAKEQRAKLEAKGFDVTSRDEMIEKLYKREQNHFEFVMRFHKIDRNQLDEIISEGDWNSWPAK